MDFEMLMPALLTTISTPPKAKQAASRAFWVLVASVTFKRVLATASLPNKAINSVLAVAKRSSLMSLMMTQAPSSANFLAMALPIPPADPVIRATRPERALGLGIRWSLASSKSQYSISKASWRGSAVYSEMASAPFITFMALM